MIQCYNYLAVTLLTEVLVAQRCLISQVMAMRFSAVILALLIILAAKSIEGRRRRGHTLKCNNLPPIDARVKKATVVFTGKVTNVAEDEVWVKVKRVVKGQVASDIALVSGLDRFPCMRRIRIHDTAVFLTDNELKLTSSLVPLTLRNLDKVNAAVKGEKKYFHILSCRPICVI